MAPKDYLGKDQRNVANDKDKKVDDIKGNFRLLFLKTKFKTDI